MLTEVLSETKNGEVWRYTVLTAIQALREQFRLRRGSGSFAEWNPLKFCGRYSKGDFLKKKKKEDRS